MPSMQVPSLKTALSSGALNPTAAEFVPGGLSAALASKAAPASDQLRSRSPTSGEASKPPKVASKVRSMALRVEVSIPLAPSLRAIQQLEKACCALSAEKVWTYAAARGGWHGIRSLSIAPRVAATYQLQSSMHLERHDDLLPLILS